MHRSFNLVLILGVSRGRDLGEKKFEVGTAHAFVPPIF